jgi:hypothetical protein
MNDDELYFGTYGSVDENNYEMVDHPKHYQSVNGIECIDAIAAATEELIGEDAFCTGTVIKYLWRWKKKEKPLEDLKKARWYIDRIIKQYEEEEDGE